MKFFIAIDNTPGDDLLHEHGLAVYFELDGKHYLADTGASGKFIRNLPVDVAEIEAVFISHGHNDHTGGLRSFIEANSTAPVFLSEGIRGNLFFSCRPKEGVREFRSIGAEQALFAEYPHRFLEVTGTTGITDKITLVAVERESGNSVPMGNEFLYKNDFPDNFSHEFALLIEYAPQEFAIISPCTHNGILNTLWSCTEAVGKKYPCNGTDDSLAAQHRNMLKCFIGGLHYVDYLKLEQGNKEAASIIETANTLKRDYPQLAIHSGHCTCAAASLLLEQELGDSYRCFRTGSIIECSTR